MSNYGSDAQFSNNMMVDFRTFAQSQGYGTSIAPEECDLYDRVLINPALPANQNNPTVITFYDQVTTDITTTVQDPVIRNGSQIPTQNLIGVYGVALEVTWERGAGAGITDEEVVIRTLAESVFEMSLAGDRQFMAKGSALLNMLGTTPGDTAAAPISNGIGSLTPLAFHVWPTTKLVMPGSTIRAALQFDGSAANNPSWAATGQFNLTLHVLAYNARR
jgi:hypothetical protein